MRYVDFFQKKQGVEGERSPSRGEGLEGAETFPIFK